VGGRQVGFQHLCGRMVSGSHLLYHCHGCHSSPDVCRKLDHFSFLGLLPFLLFLLFFFFSSSSCSSSSSFSSSFFFFLIFRLFSFSSFSSSFSSSFLLWWY
jgi:hypothetical protein